MAGNISAAGAYTNAIIQTKTAGVRTAREEKKPVWNPDKTYAYLEDMNQGFLDYGTQATSYYSSVISGQGGDGTLTVDELKKEIQTILTAKRMECRIMKLIPPGMILYFRLFSPGYLDILYGGMLGHLLMTALLAAYLFLVWLMGRITGLEI